MKMVYIVLSADKKEMTKNSILLYIISNEMLHYFVAGR